ncbi:cilia- and flagella-associated protein 119 isoform X2 [Nothobranchius furzeri]|uniref:Transcript variant X3 n=1 Tax=Nothobranchius furzeri TaxID=105023 RepID=A0A9D2XLL9_NOTFU|nr:coiled-coil domain-containing protein 189 isoform X2 [Nothobranchius furzeri]XP_054605111.1 coiled-coil domain-containing protein 189 isoform X2 [Nothobranchius furzeri]KAF7204629.1 transcript variant X3 [Nothobranchius furzeri]
MEVPRTLKAKLMLWSDVSYHNMEYIDQMQSIPELESALCRVLGVDLPEPRRGILLKLYVQTVLFCRKQSFRKEQTSTLLSIIKSIHEANIETPLNNLEQCLDYCNELLLCHCCHRPPFSVSFFSYQEANCILDYIHNSYLMHHELYKYFFAPQVQVDLPLTYSGMEKEESTASEKPGSSADNNNMESEAEPMISSGQQEVPTEQEESNGDDQNSQTRV